MTKVEKAIIKKLIQKFQQTSATAGYWKKGSGRCKVATDLDQDSIREATILLQETLDDAAKVAAKLEIDTKSL